MVEVNGVNISLGGYIIGVLNDMKEFPKHDWDVINIVVGDEGDGKTSFVKLASYYLDPSVNIDRWGYNAEQIEKIIDQDLPIGSNIIWDESDELTDHWASRIIQVMTRKFKRIRKKRYVIWLITPSCFDMRPYFVIKRTKCLFDVYADPKRDENGNFQANRGRVRFFNKDKKRILYIRGKKEWNMHAATPNFIDRFGKVPSNYPIDDSALELKKDESMKNLVRPERGDSQRVMSYRQACVSRFNQWVFSNFGRKVNSVEMAFVFGVSDRQIRRDITDYDKKFGQNLDSTRILDGVGD